MNDLLNWFALAMSSCIVLLAEGLDYHIDPTVKISRNDHVLHDEMSAKNNIMRLDDVL